MFTLSPYPIIKVSKLPCSSADLIFRVYCPICKQFSMVMLRPSDYRRGTVLDEELALDVHNKNRH